MQQPLISVITPAYNAERFIRDTIDSVLQQTYTNWEMIIVDDCSTDDTLAIVKEYRRRDARIKLIVLEENSGSAVARNKAMENASGRYIAFLDSDDRWLPKKLEKQLEFMQVKDIGFSFTTYIRILEDGARTNAISNTPASVNYDDLMKRCVIGCLTVMLDRDKIGYLKMVNIRTRQDYVYWLTITKKGFLAYGLPEILAEYRLVDNSISSNKWKAAKRNWYVFRKIEKQSLPKSIWYFAHYVVRSIMDLIKWRTKR